MMCPIENNDTFLLFFHGLDSSNETSKYTCITREPKYCQTVNYRESFAEIFEIYDALIREKMIQYPRVVLAGHSLGGWFANHFAHKYNLRALLIAPCIYPNEVLADSIPDVVDMKLSFPTTNTEMVRVMVEVDDESLDMAVARRTLVNLPDSWNVDYFEGGHHRIARSSDI
ncbi:alpha/beta hydrolase [Psychrobacter sp. ER1]|uniref:alpha/beta hydrolase n=1 Tax=Psychrobacter sp. ER1 TaxID=3406645 RepID=UPI003B4310F4